MKTARTAVLLLFGLACAALLFEFSNELLAPIYGFFYSLFFLLLVAAIPYLLAVAVDSLREKSRSGRKRLGALNETDAKKEIVASGAVADVTTASGASNGESPGPEPSDAKPFNVEIEWPNGSDRTAEVFRMRHPVRAIIDMLEHQAGFKNAEAGRLVVEMLEALEADLEYVQYEWSDNVAGKADALNRLTHRRHSPETQSPGG